MMLDPRIEKALASPDRVSELRQVAQRMLQEGSEANEVLGHFEEARLELRQANRGEDEDAVLEVMDFVTGWCSRHMKLPS